jgi:hypothetical protein
VAALGVVERVDAVSALAVAHADSDSAVAVARATVHPGVSDRMEILLARWCRQPLQGRH